MFTLPRTLWWLCLLVLHKAFYQLDPGTPDMAIFETCYIQNAFPL